MKHTPPHHDYPVRPHTDKLFVNPIPALANDEGGDEEEGAAEPEARRRRHHQESPPVSEGGAAGAADDGRHPALRQERHRRRLPGQAGPPGQREARRLSLIHI